MVTLKRVNFMQKLCQPLGTVLRFWVSGEPAHPLACVGQTTGQQDQKSFWSTRKLRHLFIGQLRKDAKPDVLVNVCNPSTQEVAEKDQEFKANLSYIERNQAG